MKNKNNQIYWIIGIVLLLVVLSQSNISSLFQKQTIDEGNVGLNIHYYKDGVEIFPEKKLFSIVTPPGGSYDQIALSISATATGNSFSNIKVFDASPAQFKNALPTTTTSLSAGESRVLWTSGLIETSQFESYPQPVRFQVQVSAKDDYIGQTVYSQGYVDLSIKPETGTLYEKYNTADNGYSEFYSYLWKAQTFTVGNTGPNENFNITSVKLKLYKAVGYPIWWNGDDIKVAIRAVNSTGFPTGKDLSIGTTNASTLTTNTAGEWREIKMSPYQLNASTKYAIVIRTVPRGESASNYLYWKIWGQFSGSPYSGGNQMTSWGGDTGGWNTPNGDAVWYIEFAGADAMFEIYGNKIEVIGTCLAGWTSCPEFVCVPPGVPCP